MPGDRLPGDLPPQSKLTEERLRKICAGLRGGLFRDQAAALAGVSRETLRRWCVRHPTVREAVDMAEAEGAAADIGKLNEIIDRAMQAEDLRLAADNIRWKASRRHGYTERQSLAVDVTAHVDGERVTINWHRLRELPDEDYKTFLRIYDLLTAEGVGDELEDTDGVKQIVDAEWEPAEGKEGE